MLSTQNVAVLNALKAHYSGTQKLIQATQRYVYLST